MKDTGILMSRPMVHAVAREAEHPGTGKTQTRRRLKMPEGAIDSRFCQPDGTWWTGDSVTGKIEHKLPVRFHKGQRLWVRETWRADDYDAPATIYQADCPEDALADTKGIIKWKPAIHLPRKRSRFTLEVTNVRVEPLQQCTEEDAAAEGIVTIGRSATLHGRLDGYGLAGTSPQDASTTRVNAYAGLWDAINGAGAWDANPWVVALTFTVAKRNIDA